jgi:long-subunit acyl-CoA synthetase (AMP-forming)
MYTTNSAEQNEIILRDSQAKIIVVENKQQLDKIIKCKENNCDVKRIIQYSGIPENNYDGLVMSVCYIRFKLLINKNILNQNKVF